MYFTEENSPHLLVGSASWVVSSQRRYLFTTTPGSKLGREDGVMMGSLPMMEIPLTKTSADTKSRTIGVRVASRNEEAENGLDHIFLYWWKEEWTSTIMMNHIFNTKPTLMLYSPENGLDHIFLYWWKEEWELDGCSLKISNSSGRGRRKFDQRNENTAVSWLPLP